MQEQTYASSASPPPRGSQWPLHRKVGAVVIAAWAALGLAASQFPALVAVQQSPVCKWTTGSLVGAVLLAQFWLTFTRFAGNTRTPARMVRHRQVGIALPVVLALHAVRPGHGYLLLMAVLLVGNIALGLLQQEYVRLKSRAYSVAWNAVHVALSVVSTGLVIFHVYQAFIFH